ncbi:MAG TPA: paraslipin [Candidatus Latescibacteria bacterium]|nr:paraslipin [Candidatus Latescibacterota bacterium]
MTYFTVLVLILLFLLLKMFVVVPMREAAVIERLGKFRIVLNPGFHFLIPFFDRIAYRHETREQVIDIPSQGCITRDNIQVEVDGLVYIQVLDPKSASYGIEDYRRAAINLAQTTMRAEIGKLSLGESFYERDALNETIVKEIDKASDPWGIKVLRYELKNITPSANVIHTLERQMEAEREKRAEITRASAEKEATINISEGNRQEDINLSEGEKQRRINVATGRAEAISILAEATAEGTEMIAAAVQKEGGSQALKMQLIEEYIETLTDITTKANVSIVPLELAKIKGFFDGLSEVADSVPSTQGRV